MRLRLLIPTLVCVMAAGMLTLAGLGLARDWQDKRAADRFVLADDARSALAALGNDWATERGLTYLLLSRRDQPGPDRLAQLASLRRRADEDQAEALRHLSDPMLHDRDQHHGPAAILAVAQRTLIQARAEIDEALAQPAEARPGNLPGHWFGTATAILEQGQHLQQILNDLAPVDDVELANHILLRHAVWVAADQAGRSRALLAGALAGGPTLDDIAESMAEANTRFTLAWENVRQLASHTGAGMPQVAEAMRAADTLIADRVEPLRRWSQQQAATGPIDPTAADAWFAAASEGIDSVQTVQAASLAMSAARARSLSDQALAELLRGSALGLVAFSMGVIALMLLQRRLLRPLAVLTDQFRRIADGQDDVDLGDTRRQDEVGDLTRAAMSFRAVHRAGQTLAEALRRRENLLDLFIRHTPTAIAMLDRNMRYVAVSRRWIQDYGLHHEDVTGLFHYDVFPDIGPEWRAIHQKCLAGEQASADEDKFVRADGSHIWVRWEIHPWPDIDGQIGGIVMFTEVITARKQAEEETLRLTTELKAIVDSADNAIIATTPGGIIRAFNRGAERMLGYKAEALIGQETPQLFHDREEVEQAIAKLALQGVVIENPFEVFVHRARQGKPDQREWTYIAQDGGRVPVLLSVTSIRDEEGAIQGFLGVANNISHLKETDRLKSEFISTVSHELRTPLTAIRASLGMVNSGMFGDLSGDARQLTDIAQESTERLIRLINDLLDIEKIASGRMRFDLRPLPLAPLLEQMLRDNAPLAERSAIRLIGTEFPPLWVKADADRLQQALTNLIGNAVKFSPAGSEVVLSAVDLGNGFGRVTVTDYGMGIDDSFRNRIFQRFAQADSSDSRAKGGTGLGLAITREIVERQGGRISFDSRPGQGSQFHIDLAITGLDTPLFEFSTAKAVTDHGNILVCEDDPDIAHLMSLLLSRAGFRTTKAYSAAEALEHLGKERFDAMTLDLMLPDLPGLTLFHTIRANPDTRSLPIIVVSAISDSQRQELDGDAVGVIDWLSKPIDEQRLVQAVHQAVSTLDDGLARLLHVEDDPDIRAIVQHLLADQGEVQSAATVADAMRLAATEPFDAGIIDIDMPDGCGLDVIPHLRDRQGRPVPIVVFTAADAGPVQMVQVAATLVKSRAPNEELVETMRGLLQRMVLPPAPSSGQSPPTTVEPAP